MDGLDKETRERLLLKEQSDLSFENALSEDYTDILFQTLKERSNPMIQHSYIGTIYGGQGCLLSSSKILTINGWKSIDEVNVGDKVLSINLKYKKEWKRVSKKYMYNNNKRLVKLTLRNGVELQTTSNHRLFVDGEYKLVSDLKVGDRLQFVSALHYGVKNKSIYLAEIVGMIVADGHLHNSYLKRKSWSNGKEYEYNAHVQKMRLYKADASILKRYEMLIKKEFGDGVVISKYYDYNTKGTMIYQIQSQKIVQEILDLGIPSGRKSKIVTVPDFVIRGTEDIRTSFLRGAFSCDGSVLKSGHIDYSSVSKELIVGLRLLLFDLGIKNKYYFRARQGINKVHSDIHRIIITEWQSRKIFYEKIGLSSEAKQKRLFNSLQKNMDYRLLDREENKYYDDGMIIKIVKGLKPERVYDITVEDNSNYVVNGLLSSNSGKSYSGLSLCGVLDPKFNIDKIYFDVELLVNDRKKLKPNTAVIVDEMTRLYGMDSVRVSIMVNAIKEQLRKKSIHMLYLSPTLKDEYHTSLYVMETMFLDKKEKCNYLAYKTNELMTLGYVVIPHPINFVSRKLLIAYEEKKDMHLSNLLDGGLDAVQDRAEQVMNNDYFIKAERMYIEARGYIPYKILVQVVEKIFPEFKGSVIVYELADRIKADKEINGTWSIHYAGKKKEEE